MERYERETPHLEQFMELYLQSPATFLALCLGPGMFTYGTEQCILNWVPRNTGVP